MGEKSKSLRGSLLKILIYQLYYVDQCQCLDLPYYLDFTDLILMKEINLIDRIKFILIKFDGCAFKEDGDELNPP